MTEWRGTYSGRSQYDLVLEITVVSQSIANNQSTIRIILYAHSKQGWGSWTTDSYPWIINYGGASISGSRDLDFRPDSTNKQLFMQNVTRVVNHNSDGTLTLSVRGRHTTSSIFGSADTGSQSWTLPRIPRVPAAPAAPTFSNILTTSARAAWNAPSNNGSAITGYDVRWSVNANMSGATLVSQGTTRTRDLTSLTPADDYYVQVRAKNAAGTGGWSAVGTFTTLPATPPGISVAAALDGTSAVATLWPPSGVSSVTSYRVERRVVGGATTVYNTASSPLNVTSLTPGQVNEWRVSAFIGSYQTPWSDWILVVQPDPSTVPGGYFDGSSPATPDVTYSWDGVTGLSISEATGVQVLGWQSGLQRVSGGRSRSYAARRVMISDTVAPGTRTGTATNPGGAVVSPGGSYVASIFVRLSRAQRGAAEISFWTAAHALISRHVGAEAIVPVSASWTRATVTAIAPATAEYASVAWIDVAGDGWSPLLGGDTITVDDAMLTLGQLSPYFDGSTPGDASFSYAWDGVAESSTSTATPREDGAFDPLADPSCPAPPAPPRAPIVADDCITPVGTWRRYWAILDASLVPLWTDAVPTFTITTGPVAAEQVRIRVYPNPDNVEPADFFEGDVEGELIVSFLPADTTLTLDGVAQRAWASVAGGSRVPADRLLYGSGGGPVNWPVLTCGQPYLIAFDVPLDAPDGNIAIDVALTGRML